MNLTNELNSIVHFSEVIKATQGTVKVLEQDSASLNSVIVKGF